MAKFHCLLILSLVLVVSMAGATQYKVGGSDGWHVPEDPKEYGQWAQKSRFRVGDSLLFVYHPDTDSVLYVNETSYHNCDTSSHSYIDSFDDGNTVFVFTRSGPHHFISGNRDNCLKNESLLVVVMADRTKAPSPSTSSSASDSPPPPKHNGASSMAMSLIGSFGALLGALFFVLA